jgi:galactokinase/mevalonate kinase-like predicted kinase
MFPKMMNRDIQKIIDQYHDKARAWKLSGAGGGGYLIMISEKEIPNAFRIKIRVKDFWI